VNHACGGQWDFRENFKEGLSRLFSSAVIRGAADGKGAMQKINSFPPQIISDNFDNYQSIQFAKS
jgi:hypothetical protein